MILGQLRHYTMKSACHCLNDAQQHWADRREGDGEEMGDMDSLYGRRRYQRWKQDTRVVSGRRAPPTPLDTSSDVSSPNFRKYTNVTKSKTSTTPTKSATNLMNFVQAQPDSPFAAAAAKAAAAEIEEIESRSKRKKKNNSATEALEELVTQHKWHMQEYLDVMEPLGESHHDICLSVIIHHPLHGRSTDGRTAT